VNPSDPDYVKALKELGAKMQGMKSAKDNADALRAAIDKIANLGPALKGARTVPVGKPVVAKFEMVQQVNVVTTAGKSTTEVEVKFMLQHGTSLRQNMQVLMRDMYRILNPKGIYDDDANEFIDYVDRLIAKGVSNGP
jgi:hypothetical protein